MSKCKLDDGRLAVPALQVRDFPETLYDQLREHAARNHRSVAQQTVAFLEDSMRRSAGWNQLAAQGCAADSPSPRVLSFENEAEREARIQKRRDIASQLAAVKWLKDPPPVEEVAALFGEEEASRERRQCEILGIPYCEEFVR